MNGELTTKGPVLGVGIDLIEVDRIARVLERQGDRFRHRVYTEGELAYCEGMKFPDPHFAARFAAKEAVSKAFGTGIGGAFGWKSAEVCKNDAGAPWIRLDESANGLLRERGAREVLLSLAHTREHATAIALLIG